MQRQKDGFKMIQRILDLQKPEAAYFIAESGRRHRHSDHQHG
jgi:hypothetical protein